MSKARQVPPEHEPNDLPVTETSGPPDGIKERRYYPSRGVIYRTTPPPHDKARAEDLEPA